MDKIKLIKTGLSELDNKIDGLGFGEMTILTGDNIGIGKFIRKFWSNVSNRPYSILILDSCSDCFIRDKLQIKTLSDICREYGLCLLVVYSLTCTQIKSRTDIHGCIYDVADNVIECGTGGVSVWKNRRKGVSDFHCLI